MNAEIHPCWTPELGAQGFPYSDRYNVVVAGKLLVKRSRDPECDAARALLAKGLKGKVTIFDGNTGRPRTIINIEKAAKVCVKEGPLRFAPYESRPERPSAGEADREVA
jgi:hypothetical protein